MSEFADGQILPASPKAEAEQSGGKQEYRRRLGSGNRCESKHVGSAGIQHCNWPNV